MKILVLLFAILIILPAVLVSADDLRPSTVIFQGEKAKLVPLSGTAWESCKIIKNSKPALTEFKPWELKNLGHYASWKADVTQTETPQTPPSLINFTNMNVALPENVTENNSNNFTELNGTWVIF